MADDDLEAKFLKSGRNRRTENAGLAVLLRDPANQVVGRDLKRLLLERLGVASAPIQAFDAVRTQEPSVPIDASNVDELAGELRLLEMKTTRKPIRDARLESFFFGVTASEISLAESLGDRYLFAFVVLNAENAYGREFFVLLSWDQLQSRIRSQRIQYQVTLKRGFSEEPAAYSVWWSAPEVGSSLLEHDPGATSGQRDDPE